MTVYLVAISAALLVVAFVIRPIFTWLAKDKKIQLEGVNRFTSSATNMIADPDFPEPLVKVLFHISESLDNPKTVHRFIKAWLGGRVISSDSAAHREFDDAMASLSKEARMRYQLTLAIGLIAMSYSAPFAGLALRHLLFKPVGMPERSEDAPLFAYTTARSHCVA
jgi:hypothetical protein